MVRALLALGLIAGLLGAPRVAAAGGYASERTAKGEAGAAGTDGTDDSASGSAAAPGPPATPGADADSLGCGPALAARVQQRYDGIRTFSARFRQITRSAALAGAAPEVEESRGRVVLAKPGRMRWRYEAPEPSLVVSDGVTLWIYDPEAREVQKLPVGQGFLSGAAVQFLLGEGRLEESFRIRAEDCGDAGGRLVLMPRRPATYERLVLEVGADTGLVRATEVHDLFGGRVRIEFSDVELDRPVEADRFRFEVPEGVSVIGFPEAR